MNIGIVSTWFPRGAAYVSKLYLNSIVAAGHRAYVFARGGEGYAVGDPEWDGPHVTWGRRFDDGWTRVDISQFEAWCKKYDIDIIIFNEQKDWEVVEWCNRRGIRSVAYIDYYTEETVPFFGLYDALICHTKRHFSVFNWHPQCWYVPWGTDISLFRPKMCGPTKFPIFFHSAGMGGINLRKGTDLVVQAFRQLKGECRLVIHSQVPVESYGEIGRLIATTENIEFVHATVEPPGLYSRGNVYVYPSRLDGLGLTLPEALASGLACVTTDEPPMNEFVRHGETGLLVRVAKKRKRFDGYYWPEVECDLGSLVDCMQFFVDNANTISRFSCAAREYAVRFLDWEKNAMLLRQCLESVVKLERSDEAKKLGVKALSFSKKQRWERKKRLLLNKVKNKIRKARFRREAAS
ncbi:glycosyltransferase family 4 protein [Deferrisoma palaeochoriense]